MLLLDPTTSVVKKMAAVGGGVPAQSALVADVVVDDPLTPERGSGVEIELHARPTGAGRQASCWSWVEADPAGSGKIRLNPGVGVAGTHHILAGKVIEFTPAEPGDDSRRNA